MNESQIESLLRRPPHLSAPAGLKAQLVSGIQLSRETSSNPGHARVSMSASFWRRWFPALSFGALLLGCFIMVAWQTNEWLNLREENKTFRASLPDIEELRSKQAALQKRVASAKQAASAAREQEELVRLRDEVVQLTTHAQEVATLQAKNQRLKTEIAAAIAKAGLEPERDPFEEQKGRARRISCVSNLKQIGLACRMWANDHNEVFPPNFQSASNELNTPKILTCPGDSTRTRANTWQEFNSSSVSYEFLFPGGKEGDPSIVLTRCPLHNNIGLTDGSVQQLGPQQRIERGAEGNWRIARNPQQ